MFAVARSQQSFYLLLFMLGVFFFLLLPTTNKKKKRNKYTQTYNRRARVYAYKQRWAIAVALYGFFLFVLWYCFVYQGIR